MLNSNISYIIFLSQCPHNRPCYKADILWTIYNYGSSIKNNIDIHLGARLPESLKLRNWSLLKKMKSGKYFEFTQSIPRKSLEFAYNIKAKPNILNFSIVKL